MKVKKINYRRLFYNNKFVAVFSLFISFCIWIKFSSGTSEIATKTITNIPITVELSKNAKENGLSIFGLEDIGSEVTVSGNRIILGQLSKDNIQVYAHQSEGIIDTTGNYTLELRARKVGILTDYEFESSVSPKFINIFVDRFKSKTFNITSEIAYTADPKYFSPVSLSESSITISGPDSIVSNISKVCIEKDITNPITQTTTIKELPIQIYDNTNKKITSKYLSYSTNKVDATILVLSKKNIPLSSSYNNSPSTWPFRAYQIKLTPESIEVAAPKDIVNSLAKIELEPLDFSRINLTNNTFELPLKIPAECRNLSNAYSANLKINMNGIQSKKINVNRVKFINVPANRQATSSTLSLKVEVLGPSLEIKKISSDDIFIQVDLSNKEGFTGSTELPAQLKFNSSKTSCWIYGSYSINAEIK